MKILVRADGILDSLRSLVLVVDDHGTIAEARGGFGGFLGLPVEDLPGTSVFDHVHPDDAHALASYFLESRDEPDSVVAVPMPFRMRVCSADGVIHEVDVIPSGFRDEDGEMCWTAEVVPVSLFGTSTRSLDLELAGAPRGEVCRMLCEELTVDNVNYTSRWVLVDLTDPDRTVVTTARPDEFDLVEAVRADLDVGWTPWQGIEPGETRSLDRESIGSNTIALLVRRRWHRVIVAPIVADGRPAGALLLLGSVPPGYRHGSVKSNVAARIQRLVRTTEMLFERWAVRDRLAIAASHDHLTGLLNRRAFFEALDAERRDGAVLFVDVDEFKDVNDSFGHEVGDRVLREIADRIAGACRSGDVAARLGGDEFVVLARPADDHVAEELVQRIRRAVERPLGLDVGPEFVTVSVGHAPLGASGGRAAIDVADAMMLRRKRTHREGRVEVPLPRR